MKKNLTSEELVNLIKKVFAPKASDLTCLVVADVPNEAVQDTAAWQDRREIARDWVRILAEHKEEVGIPDIRLLYFENTGSNNADLPELAYLAPAEKLVATMADFGGSATAMNLKIELGEADIAMALTQFSATAPLKLIATRAGLRAASMPGFNRKMIPALGLDFEAVHQRVMQVKSRLDAAQSMEMVFEAEGRSYEFFVDLRFRIGHASSGLLREPAMTTNLPSGEAFIVPYEGELREQSKTAGLLPVQFDDEVVIYRIEKNRAIAVESQGEKSSEESRRLAAEPAYGNIAEIGVGVLQEFGIRAIGEVMLDEKLGLHIAFGRSDHFGGQTSPAQFHDPRNVVHIDRVYVPEIQPKVAVKSVTIVYPENRREVLFRDSVLVV